MNTSIWLFILYSACFSMMVLGVLYFFMRRLAIDPQKNNRQLLNKNWYLSRLAELTAEFDRSEISKEQYESMKIELQKQSYADLLMGGDSTIHASNKTSRQKDWLLMMIFPVLAMILYFVFSFRAEVFEWENKKEFLAQQALSVFKKIETKDPLPELSLSDFVLGIQYVLQKQPLDADLWMFLGKVFLNVGGNDYQGYYAYRRAYDLAPDRIEVALSYVEVIMARSQGKLDEESDRILSDIIKKHPQEPRALLFLGMAAFQSADYARAAKSFETLLSLPQQGALTEEAIAGRTFIEGWLDKSREKINEQFSQPQAIAAANASWFDAIEKIRFQLQGLTLEDVKGRVLFVFVKGSTPMPLAAKKIYIQSWPMEVSFSKADLLGALGEPPSTFTFGAKVVSKENALQDVLFSAEEVKWNLSEAGAADSIEIKLKRHPKP
jgi:cytochrome c-type biogenesis protein CcmH